MGDVLLLVTVVRHPIDLLVAIPDLDRVLFNRVLLSLALCVRINWHIQIRGDHLLILMHHCIHVRLFRCLLSFDSTFPVGELLAVSLAVTFTIHLFD